MTKPKITVTALAVKYLEEVFCLPNDEAHKVWSYHCRKHPYAMKARNQDIQKTKVLGKGHLDSTNISAYEWLTVNRPDHPFLQEFEKWKEKGEEK